MLRSSDPLQTVPICPSGRVETGSKTRVERIYAGWGLNPRFNPGQKPIRVKIQPAFRPAQNPSSLALFDPFPTAGQPAFHRGSTRARSLRSDPRVSPYVVGLTRAVRRSTIRPGRKALR